jgi:hypothetical protein
MVNELAAHLLSMPSQHPAVKKLVRDVIERHRPRLLLQLTLSLVKRPFKREMLEGIPCEQLPLVAQISHLL